MMVNNARAAMNFLMRGGSSVDPEKARRFWEAALPHLDEVYTLARYLLRDGGDAEDAAQECYLRALRYFDSYRGPAIKPWLFAILRNLCRGEFARRSGAPLNMGNDMDAEEDAAPLWQEEQASPETQIVHVTGTRIAEDLLGVSPNYASVLMVQWKLSPWLGFLQMAAVLAVWTHAIGAMGCSQKTLRTH